MEIANRYGMRIEAVFSTHVHADHRSGERELAALAGAANYHHRSAELEYAFTPLDDGAEISLGNVVVRALHTPGHTPESLSFLVTDRTRSDEPWMVLSGDTLFVGDVGRPDFGGDDAGRQLHASLQRLLALPDYVEVYPAHISGSPCGRAMSGKPSSTIGFERRHNGALAHADPDTFVAALFEGLTPKPPGFLEMIATNRHGGEARTRGV
ncbi:MAG: beta-lactamase domain protein [Candidatus Eremiobacteraeota bacterium]|nr:beta-lactamase domain protein [Candidatus Eremiobacteraeota bacterium]